MPGLREKLELALNAHEVGVRVVDYLETLDDFVDVLFYQALRPQMALIVQLRVADVADVLCQVLPNAES